ncbi:MAG: DUF2341 domain-containing protein [Acidobacteria bacterium]|nr:DUF2341 domain-containing protein [Acidobacteriota bacterium]MCI0720797.1 DUF2341 domain-containing protein [Acidobacteriota bacterium]
MLALKPSVAELRDFPALVVLDSALVDYSTIRKEGTDLRFVNAQGQVLSHEIEQWNPAGRSYVWVRIRHRPIASGSAMGIQRRFLKDDLNAFGIQVSAVSGT